MVNTTPLCGVFLNMEWLMEEEKTKKPAIKLGTLTMEKLDEINAIFEKSDKKDIYKSQVDEKMTVAQYQEEHKQRQRKVMETKLPPPFNFNHLTLTIDEIKQLPTDELLKLLSGESHKGAIHDSMIQLISNEILSREIKEAAKPNWTIKPALFLLIATLFLTAIPAAKTIYDFYLEMSKSENNHTNKSEKIKPSNSPQ